MENLDQFSLASNVNSDVDNDWPHDGHFPLYGLMMSFNGFSIFIVVIFFPHLPHVTSTDIKSAHVFGIIKNPL